MSVRLSANSTSQGVNTFGYSGSGEAAGPARCLSFQETMDTCLGPLGGTLGLQPGDEHELLSDLNTTKTLCQAGKLQDAMTCLEQVYNDCAAASRAYGYHQRQPNSINLMLDFGKWRNGMERLCANIDYLQEHEQCTRVIAVESSHCIKRETQSFMDKSSLVLAKALRRGRTGHKQLMNLGCHFAQNVILCFQIPLDKEKSCPCRYRHLMVDIVMDSMPPFCKPDQDYYYYVYGDCSDEDDDDEGNKDSIDIPEDLDGAAGYSGYQNSNAKNLPSGGESHQQGGSFQKGGDTPGEVVIVQKPQLGRVEGEKGVYKVLDVGQSQGHLGSGSGSRSEGFCGFGVARVSGLVVAGLVSVMMLVM
ncbi:hypothetical protein ACOMHN_053751 [Nucella lapillus]